ncbi:MAG: flavodoxin family protein [Agathobacter sp.]|uniref:flavodoxin family protein n=1 Tax=Agathobacter sp. TaxID=2021311 RepID=UPI00257EEBB4|nr:flavodoxin family protein [Agathobacter sp.]MBQ1682568.1 flavodoxin family protein [Agathobacter sp.]
MKVLGICAGRKNGNSEILVKEALLACQEAGAEVKMINLFDYHIEHCTGCEGCTMQMGNVQMGKQDKYNGCVLKDKDDMDKIVNEMQTCNGIIVGVPTYDLTPSSLYLKFAQRFLAYELSFRLEIGDVKEDPHTVAGVISVGGSCHDWQTLALEGVGATMFTQSVQVVDAYLSTRNGRPGNVLLRDEQIARAHQVGEHVIQAINTPVEERGWLGDPDQGLCPNCHSGLIFRGEPHWDGIQWPFECAVCGAGGDLVRGEDGKVKFVLAENGLIRDRNKNSARAEHLNEIIKTRIEFFENQATVQEKYKKYKELTFPAI